MTPPGEKPKNIGETELAQPEVEGLTELEQKLLDAITPPEHLRQEWLRQLSEIQQKIELIQLTQAQRDAVRAGITNMCWVDLNPNQELPPELCLYVPRRSDDSRDQRQQLRVGPRPDLKGTPELQYLFRDKFKGLRDERQKFFESRRSEIEPILADLIRSGPQYAFLKTFDIEQPAITDQPLNQHWRRIRENQIEEDIRHRFGIPKGEHIPLHSEADRELRKSFQGLDSETMPRKEEEKIGGLTKFRAWLKTQLKYWMDDTELKKLGEPIDFRSELVDEDGEGEEYTIQIVISKSGEQEAFDIDEWSKALCEDERPHGGYYSDTGFDEDLAYHMVHNLDQARSVGELLELAVQETVATHAFQRAIDSNVRLSLLRLRGDVYPASPNPNGNNIELETGRKEVGVVNKDRLIADLDRHMGSVERREHPDGINRIISHTPASRNFPFRTNKPVDLVINFSHNTQFAGITGSEGLVPVIPGFETVAKDGPRWMFTKSEADPYQGSANITIESEHVRDLADTYDSLGLHALADSLRTSGDVSVADLVKLVRANSDYTFDRAFYMFDLDSLDNFSQAVQNGRLQVQCSGAAAFLGMSLEKVLPESMCTQISGLVLNASTNGRIDGASHAQILLGYKGQQYILDATPPAPEGLDVTAGEGFDRMANTVRDEPKELPDKPKPLKKIESEKPIPLEIVLEESEELLIESVRKRVQEVLRQVFNAPNDQALYQLAIGLKEGDPIRQSLAAVLRLQPGQTVLVEGVLDYLETYSKANASLIKNAGLPQYDPALISLLTAALQTVVK